MRAGRADWWGSVERWSGTAFAVAGGASLGTAALFGIETYTAATYPGWLTGLTGLAGLLAAFVGLAGLYPALADAVPRLARTGLGAAVLAGAGLVVFPLCALAKSAALPVPFPPILAFVAAMVAILLAFLTFGIAGLWSGALPRTVGVLLLATMATFVVLFAADMAYGGSPEWVDFGVGSVQALLLLRVGQLLPTTGPDERVAKVTDAASG